MLTQPAPLDEIAESDGLEQFRVSSEREVALLLKQLADGSVLLNLSAGDGAVFTSVIWTIDGARATIGFNADPNDPAMQALLGCAKVTVVGYLDAVKVQFDVRHPKLVEGSRASVLSCSFPREMLRFQRRNSFRVRPLVKSGPTARLRHPDMGSELELRVVDLSLGGMALFLPVDLPMMNVGAYVGGVRVQLDAETRLLVDLRLIHATLLKAEAGGLRVGFSFVRPSGEVLRTLQRFIDATQKRGRLMALN